MADDDFELARKAKRALYRVVRHVGPSCGGQGTQGGRASTDPAAEFEPRPVRREVVWMLSEIGNHTGRWSYGGAAGRRRTARRCSLCAHSPSGAKGGHSAPVGVRQSLRRFQICPGRVTAPARSKGQRLPQPQARSHRANRPGAVSAQVGPHRSVPEPGAAALLVALVGRIRATGTWLRGALLTSPREAEPTRAQRGPRLPSRPDAVSV